MTFEELARRLRAAEGVAELEPADIERTLETLRVGFAESTDPYERRWAISALVGGATDPAWRDILGRLRDKYDESTLASMIGEIQGAFDRSAEDGWAAWVRMIAEAVRRFCDRYTLGLCAHEFAFDDGCVPRVADMRRAVRRMADGRWEEVEEELEWLASQEVLPVPTRADLLTTRAAIEMWRFNELERAADLLNQAQTLMPDDGRILATVGSHNLLSGNLDAAKEYFQRAIGVDPRLSDGYVGMGDLNEKNEDYQEAEVWYRRAISDAGGDVDGYERLSKLLARRDVDAHRTEILEVLDRRNAIDPEKRYDALLMIGYACIEAGHFDEARVWFEKAKSEAPQRPAAYVELAGVCAKQGNPEDAELLGRTALKFDPEYPNGYFILGPLYEEQRRWEEIKLLYERFPERPHRWKLFARTEVARMRCKLGEKEAGVDELFEVLREEAQSDRKVVYARDVLERIADESYSDHDDPEMALRLFDRILDVVGEKRYRARYHNLVGNLHFHRRDYAQAAAQYRLASEAEPSSADYHRYRSEACRELGNFEEASREIERAFADDNDAQRRDADLALLANMQGNRAFGQSAYKEAIEHYKRAVMLAPRTAVYCSNLALAWEQYKLPGSRIEHLAEAQYWYRKAQQVAGDQSQARRIELLDRRKKLAKTWGEQTLDWISVLTPIKVELADDIVDLARGDLPNRLNKEMDRAVSEMRGRFLRQLGIVVPGVSFRQNKGLPGGMFIVVIDEIPAISTGIKIGHKLFIGSKQRLEQVGVNFTPAENVLLKTAAAWVAESDCARLGALDGELLTCTEYLVRNIELVLRRSAADFVGHQEVINLLLQSTFGRSIRGSSSTVSALTNVCKALVAEYVPICRFEELSQEFNRLYNDRVRPLEIVERIRQTPPFLQSLLGKENGSGAAASEQYIMCSDSFEEEIRFSLYPEMGEALLAMEPVRCETALGAVRSARNSANSVLIVKDQKLRPFVRKLVKLEFQDLPVLSLAEERDGASRASLRIDLDFPRSAQVSARDQSVAVDRLDPAPAAATGPGGSPRVELVISPGLRARYSPADDKTIDEMLFRMRDQLFEDLGILAPPVLVGEDETVVDPEFEIRLEGAAPVRLIGLREGECLVDETLEILRPLKLYGREDKNSPLSRKACTIIGSSKDQVQACRNAGLTIWGPAGYAVLHLQAKLRNVAAALQTDEATAHLLDALSSQFPDLVDMALQRFSIAKIGQVLRHLLAEEISVRDLRGILEALLSLAGTTDVDFSRFIVFGSDAEPVCPDPQTRSVSELPASRLADHVRTCLKRYISCKYTSGSNTLLAYLITPPIEKWLREAYARQDEKHIGSRLTEIARNKIQGSIPANAAVLTNFEIRGLVRQILKGTFPMLPVLCYQELLPGLNISLIARIDG